MQPRGPLMVEHRLIMRMISLIDQEVKRIEKSNIVDQSFVDKTVEFLRSYADRTHHGKEENILFRDLAKKKLSDIDNSIMNELVQEHAAGRATTAALVAAAETCRNGDASGLPVIKECLRKFVDFYPRHIEKEDKIFFPSSMAYFSGRSTPLNCSSASKKTLVSRSPIGIPIRCKATPKRS